MAKTFERRLRVAAITGLALLGMAGRVSSQTPQPPAGNTWSHGTTLELSAGAAHVTPNTAAATFGTAVGWELNHRAEIEGVAAWFPEQRGAESFAADLKLLVNLTRPARVVPYLGAGAGLYVASFDATRVTPARFYERRMPFSSPAHARFTDPTIIIAGGANMFTARHLSVRPELGGRLVLDGSHVYPVTTFTVSLIYHVEDHPGYRVK